MTDADDLEGYRQRYRIPMPVDVEDAEYQQWNEDHYNRP